MDNISHQKTIHNFRAAAGLIATNWSLTEDLIEATVWTLVKLKPKYGRVLTAHIGFVSQCNIVKMLLEDGYPLKFKKEEWTSLISETEHLRLARNSIVHGRWESLIESAVRPTISGFEYKGKNSLKGTVVAYSLDYMLKTASDIDTFNARYRVYLEKNFRLKPSLYRPDAPQPNIPRPLGRRP